MSQFFRNFPAIFPQFPRNFPAIFPQFFAVGTPPPPHRNSPPPACAHAVALHMCPQAQQSPQRNIKDMSFWTMLKHRSRFSNHPIIDTQWEPDPHLHWSTRTRQAFGFTFFRGIFHFQIVRSAV